MKEVTVAPDDNDTHKNTLIHTTHTTNAHSHTHTHTHTRNTLTTHTIHAHSHTHLIGLLWARDRPVRGLYPTNTQHSEETNMSAAEFEPAFPASKHPQAYAFDNAATGVRASTVMKKKIPASFSIIAIPPSIHLFHAKTLYSANSSEMKIIMTFIHNL